MGATWQAARTMFMQHIGPQSVTEQHPHRPLDHEAMDVADIVAWAMCVMNDYCIVLYVL